MMSDAAPDRTGATETAEPEGPLDRLGLDVPERGTETAEPEPDADATASPELDASSPAAPAGSDAGSPAAPAAPVLGGYVPPSAVHRPDSAGSLLNLPLAAAPTVGAAPPAPVPTWTPPPAPAWTPPAPPVAPLSPPPAPLQPGRTSLFADLPFDAPDSVTEWLVAIGSSAAAISFLLPWISGTTSYLTSWGLGAPSRLPLLALLIVTAVLGILPNRVALWVRAGVLGLIAGSLFLGNLWPIVAGDFGDAAFGAVIGAAAAVVLIVGGILAVAPRKPGADLD